MVTAFLIVFSSLKYFNNWQKLTIISFILYKNKSTSQLIVSLLEKMLSIFEWVKGHIICQINNHIISGD